LTGYKNSKGTAAAYAYLPSHYRMSKTVDGVVTQHIWDGDNVVAEANSANAILRSYTRGHQLLTDDDRRAYMYDGHGNLVQQNRGTAAENVTRYDAYGNKIEKSGTANDTPFGYCGEYLDKESGLIYLRNRYYDSESGRFISEDPIRSGMNWYSYCSNDPINKIDPWGLIDVFARNYLEERGAEVTYTGNGTASVRYNGKTYKISGTINSDGRMVMDDTDIDNILGWTATVYYFYGSDQTEHATSNIKDLRNNGYAVISTLITSTSDFTDAYNAMPSTVDIVIVNQHGSPSSVSYMNLSKLDMTKRIGTFVLLSCNAGHQWTGSESMASQIANASGGNIEQLIAADGTHFRGRFWNPYRGIKVEGDSKWEDYIDSSFEESAKSQGFIRYQWNGTSYEKNSIGHSFSSVRSLLKKVGA
ncbi:MAG: RHS repeat-associated core domain-containing protein, partial [Clostridia bacterium]|nr:RHS repeat-associated core domain-containing protein [Clostridia bacterium]